MGEPDSHVSIEEYLALDEASDLRHEYLNGIVVAMAGASPRHNVVTTNILAALPRRPTTCRATRPESRRVRCMRMSVG